MDENFDELVINVRATTDGFNADLETMRGALDTSLVDGFDRAGSVLERGLSSALRRGAQRSCLQEDRGSRTMQERQVGRCHSL